MTDRIFAGASVLMTSLAALTGVTRLWPAPSGRHRAKPARLLPDQPFAPPVEPVPGVVLDEDTLALLLDEGAAEPTEMADCPCCYLRTGHAVQVDGRRRCWTCGTESAGGA